MHCFYQPLNFGLALAVFWVGAMEVAEASQCNKDRTLQQIFCNAAFALKGRLIKVEGPDNNPDWDRPPLKYYTFYVDRVFKGEGIPRRQEVEISTMRQDTLPVQENISYVISGDYYPDGSLLTRCTELNEAWATLSRADRRGLSSDWQSECN